MIKPMTNMPVRYQAIVTEVYPLLSKKKCYKCKREWKRAIGWKVTYEVDKELFLCKQCTPTKKEVINFCNRKNIVIKEFKK
jgi:hypothetical protein